MKSLRSRVVFVLVIGVALVIILVAQFWPEGSDNDSNGASGNVVQVKGYVGSEKVDFLNNAEIQEILRDNYGIEVDYTSLGSIEQVEASTTGMDFLWPSNEVALALYRENHPGAVKSETIFNSPIVIYSWTPVVDALIQEGLVEVVDDIYFADVAQLVNLIIVEDKSWSDVGLPDLYGRINIISTDPTKSNSGNMFYGLLANLLVSGDVADDTSIETVLEDIKTYYQRLGRLEEGSGKLFKSFINTGMGANPIIVGYESQLIEFSLENEANRDQILGQIRIVYPRPTVWSSHPLIALTDNGEKLMQALQDDEIQRIAWEQHGFRSGLLGVENDPEVLSVANIPANIDSVIPLPRPSVMRRLIDYLSVP